MNFVTQIGGEYSPHNKPLLQLKKKLESIGVIVNQSLSDKSILDHHTATSPDKAVFSIYSIAVDYYESIAETDLHIVANSADDEGYIGEDTARELLYAMLKDKPIVLLFEPKLTSLDPFTRDILTRQEHGLYISNLLELPDRTLATYLQEVKAEPKHYTLSPRERTLIRARIRAYFRSIVSSSKVTRAAT